MGTDAHEQNDNSSAEKSDLSSGGESVDFKSLFGQTQQELETYKSENAQLKSDFEAFKGSTTKAAETLEKLRAAFSDSTGEVKDAVEAEIDALEAEIQTFVDAAHQADKAGKPIPLTAKIGIDSAKARIKYLKENKELRSKLSEVDEKLKKVTDPGFVAWQQFIDRADLTIDNALNSLYGKDPRYNDVKQAQTTTLSHLVGKEFKRLEADDPESWARVRRDPKALQALVNHFVKESIPPVARQLMEREEIRKTPQGTRELLAAFREAQEAGKKDPKKALTKLEKDQLRREIWASHTRDQFKGRNFRD